MMDDISPFEITSASPPEFAVLGRRFINEGYNKSKRCYQIRNDLKKPAKIMLVLFGNKTTPVINPVFYVKYWNSGHGSVAVNDKIIGDCRIGINHTSEGDHLVLFLYYKCNKPVVITIRDGYFPYTAPAHHTVGYKLALVYIYLLKFYRRTRSIVGRYK